MPKIAFVTPWLGDSSPGGAETLALTTAQHLRQSGIEAEMLTTCIGDIYHDWSRNHHEPGTSEEHGVPIHRFRVKRRRTKAFDRLNRRIGRGETLTPRQERTFIRHMFVAPSLYRYVKKHQDDYLFFPIPYMFASTYFTVSTAPTRSLVIPCLHDEAYARLGIYHGMLRAARGLVFNTDAEAALAASLVEPVKGQIRRVIGSGIETDVRGDGQRFREVYGIEGAIMLYAGRGGEGKNVPLLVEYWNRYMETSQRRATLVFIGSPTPDATVSGSPFIRDLGYLSAQDKYDAFSAADVLCQPSLNESFSLVMMEAWVQGTPAMVHARCAVTSEHCARSQGGLTFASYQEFVASVIRLLDSPDDARRMGQRGRQYVLDNYRWQAVVAKYQDVIAEACATS